MPFLNQKKHNNRHRHPEGLNEVREDPVIKIKDKQSPTVEGSTAYMRGTAFWAIRDPKERWCPC